MRGYFDYAASAPPFEESIDVFKKISLTAYGNPSSSHSSGVKAKNILDKNKEEFLKCLGIKNASIVLTSGGSEANNLVINSIYKRFPGKKILIANDSHASCYYATKIYAQNIDILPVDYHGQINPEKLECILSKEYSMVCLLHGNNETGIIQHSLQEIIKICKNKNILLHIDGVQTVGHIPVNIEDFKNIFLTFSSHKFGAPRGSGGIITGSPDLLTCLISGGPQENNLRAGTENVAAFAAAVNALELSIHTMSQVENNLIKYCDYVKKEIKDKFPSVIFNSNAHGLPGLVSLSIPEIQGNITVMEMGIFGYALSAGSACHSGMKIPSRVIMAMGRDMKTALGTLRISMGYNTIDEDVYGMTETLIKVIDRQLNE